QAAYVSVWHRVAKVDVRPIGARVGSEAQLAIFGSISVDAARDIRWRKGDGGDLRLPASGGHQHGAVLGPEWRWATEEVFATPKVDRPCDKEIVVRRVLHEIKEKRD